MGPRARLAPALLAALVGCATLGTEGQGDRDLPTTGAGPFRKLAASEVPGVAPFVFDSSSAHYREPAVIAVDPAGSTGVALYAVAAVGTAGATHDVIVRTRADDARAFYATSSDTDATAGPPVVLAADALWEGGESGDVRSPTVLAVGARIYLYYAAKGGVGLAVSNDGLAFQKSGEPVLAPDPTVAWETGAPAAPSVALFPDGTMHMLYAAGPSIGEATSRDGLTWSRVDGDPSTPALDPVLVPAAPVDPATLGVGEKPPFDTGQVTDPCLVPRVTPAGRLQVRVLYTGYDGPPGAAGRASTIGFAARYGDLGALERQPTPIYSVGKHEAAPALFEWDGGAMLYVHQDYGTKPAAAYPSIAAAFAPATSTLPAPAPYATGP